MSFEYKNGVTYASITDFLEDVTDGLYATLLAAGWTLHNEIVATSGITDKVFKSTGEAGDEIIFIRITQTAATKMLLRTASYYVAAGVPGANDGNELGADASTSQYAAVAAFVGWIACDKDFCVFSQKQDSYYGTFGFGTLKRHAPTQWSARTSLDGDQNILAHGTNTQIAVNAFDVTKLTVGQKLFIVNFGDTHKGTITRCTLVSIDSAILITVEGDDANQTDFDSNALVALDPMPTCILGMNTTWGGGSRGSTQWGGLFIYQPATTRMTGNAQAVPVNRTMLKADGICCAGVANLPQKTTTYVTLGGAARGEFAIWPFIIIGGVDNNWTLQPGQYQLRGYIERVCMVTYGVAVSPEDTMSDGDLEWLIIRDEDGAQLPALYGVKFIAIRTVA